MIAMSLTILTEKNRRAILILTFALIVGAAVSRIPFDGLSEAGRLTFGIFTVAALLWVLEPFPLYVTSFIIVILEVVLLGRSGGPLGLKGSGYMIFLNPFFSSVVVLLLGGFVMAQAVKRYGIDTWLLRRLLRRIGNKPGTVLLGMMVLTAFLSMWISNTATTALMMAIALPVVSTFPGNEPFRRAMILGIPFASNIGGIGTPIGSPPNAIAIGFLEQSGFEMTFLGWMTIGVPIVIVLIFVCWLTLFLMNRPKIEHVELELSEEAESLDNRSKFILASFLLVVILWLTSSVHGIPSSIVALVPFVLFFGLRLLDDDDLRELGWGILFIVGGGMSLGVAMNESGLSAWIVSQIDFAAMGTLAILLLFALAAVIMTTFISNSATANLLLPIVVGITAVSPTSSALVVAIAASAAMILPVSTPPNAIAYGSGQIEVKDMAGAGSVITAISMIFVTLVIYFLF
jgi:sodium-dependent dicarboxylate transporter 2/3/5